VQSLFCTTSQLRTGFDVVLPPALGPADGDVWHPLSMLVPARRTYLISFVGELARVNSLNNTHYTAADKRSADRRKSNVTDGVLHRHKQSLLEILKNKTNTTFNHQESKNIDEIFIAMLKLAQPFSKSELFHFQFSCDRTHQSRANIPTWGSVGEWALCANKSVRAETTTFDILSHFNPVSGRR